MAARLTEPTDPGVVRLLRLENRSGSHSKFYSPIVEADPSVPGAFRCRAEYGRIGGHVSSVVKASGSALTCERALEDLAREKQRGGYTVVLDQRGTGGAVAAKSAPERAAAEVAEDDLTAILARRKREASWAL